MTDELLGEGVRYETAGSPQDVRRIRGLVSRKINLLLFYHALSYEDNKEHEDFRKR